MKTLWQGIIPVDAKDIVETRIERVAKRAQRLGFPVPSAVYGSETTKHDPESGSDTQWVNLSIVADGDLRLGEWEFIGVLSELEDGTPFLTTPPGVMAPQARFMFASVNNCDHCHTYRERNDTYVVHKNGEGYKQVGSSCIKDFTGHSPASIVGWLGALDELSFSDEEVGGWGRSATRFYDPSYIIEVASRIVAVTGYISKAKAEETQYAEFIRDRKEATSEVVRRYLSATGRELRELTEKYAGSDESRKLYDDTMAALKEVQPTSDWAADIARLSASTGVQWRHVGILASAVVLGLRQQERKVTELLSTKSEFFGEIGQRLSLTGVKVRMKRSFEGSYGTTFIFRFDVDGNDAVWFASWSQATENIQEGDVINIVATVKNHEFDQRSGRPTTVLTRATIKEA